MKKILIAAGLLFTAGAGSSASAAVVACSTGPTINLVADGCTASGNDHLGDVEAALAAALGVNVNTLDLSLYGKSDSNPGLFSFTPKADPSDGKSTNWTVLDGTMIKYVTVKASTSFKLYEVAGLAGASTGLGYSTLGLLNKGGKQPDISHLSFWTVPVSGAVPEPATWAMMIGGLTLVGSSMRRRKTSVSFA